MLDIGCGNGLYALEAKRRGMWVCAVDVVPEMVASIPSPVDEVHVADVENFRPGDQYDRVICAGVLDFVREPKRAFLNLCRLVAPGGKLVILVPRIGIAGLFYRFAKLRLGIRVNLYSVAWFRRVSVETEVSVNSWSSPLPHNIAMLLTHRHSDLRAPPSVSCRARDSAIKK
jgi:SAM-dependent methyltransferase